MDIDQEKQPQFTDLPDLRKEDSDKVAAEVAGKVKGGVRNDGGDDDLEDLEVERFKKK